MYGVSKINIETDLMMISVQDVAFRGNSLSRYLDIFAETGVVVDMISQSAPHGTTIDFSFTASSSDLPLVMKAISAANLDKDAKASPLISVGYSKLNLFGEDMVASCGVAARALNALAMAGIEVLLITTSDLDISLLVHAENEDAAYEALKKDKSGPRGQLPFRPCFCGMRRDKKNTATAVPLPKEGNRNERTCYSYAQHPAAAAGTF